MIDIDVTFFIQLVAFFVLFFILRSLIFKPVIALFDARVKGTEGARAEARALEEKAETEARAFEEEMKKVKTLAGEERDRLRADGLKLEQSLLTRVREETAEMLEKRRGERREEASRVRKELETELPLLARRIASAVLGREVI